MHTFYLRIIFTGLFLLFLNKPLLAAEPDLTAPPPLNQDNTDIPSSVPSTNDETEVTIIKKKETTIEEVRVQGKLRYAKVTPKYGKVYYLYDSNGDGILDATETDLKKANINQWILMKW